MKLVIPWSSHVAPTSNDMYNTTLFRFLTVKIDEY